MSETPSVAEGNHDFSREVGARLRAVRRQRQLSLDEVEQVSGGRWSASAVGAYERGFRNLSLPRLRDLATFYNVPMGVLLGEPTAGDPFDGPDRKVVIDLVALEEVPEAAPVSAFTEAVVARRGDWNGRVLSIRRDDVGILAWTMGLDEQALVERMEGWGLLARSGAVRVPDDAPAGGEGDDGTASIEL